MAQMSASSPLHTGVMNSQRMMRATNTQIAGMQMRGMNQGGPRMAHPGMKNS